MPIGKQKYKPVEDTTFGAQLRALRIERGVDLEAVARETRIAVSTLQRIETEDYANLPDAVFVKGHIKAYAGALGVCPDRYIQGYLVGRQHYEQLRRLETGRLRSGSFLRPWLLIACLFICGGIAVYFTMQAQHRAPTSSTDREKKAAPDSTDGTGHTALQTTTAPAQDKTAPPLDGHELRINTIEVTWLKIIIDGQSPKQYMLNPGDRLELTAGEGFNLLIGNATGLQLWLDNRFVPIDGKHGQVVSLKLP